MGKNRALFLFAIAGLLAASVQAQGSSPSQTAQALLMPEDLQGLQAQLQCRPSFIQFNDRLYTDKPPGYDYFVTRSWYQPANGWIRIGNSISVYPSAELARQDLENLAESDKPLPEAKKVGDKTEVVYEEMDEWGPAGVAYRFVVGRYAAKVQIYRPDNKKMTKGAIARQLLPLAHAVAAIQEKKLRRLAAGPIPFQPADPKTFPLPVLLPDTVLLGEAPISALEWRTMENDLKKTVIPGLQKAVFRRFQLRARPAEVVDVTLFRFATPEGAQKFTAELKARKVPKIAVPAGLRSIAVAVDVEEAQALELRGHAGPWVFDLILSSPFGTLQKEAARKDLFVFGETVHAQIRTFQLSR